MPLAVTGNSSTADAGRLFTTYKVATIGSGVGVRVGVRVEVLDTVAVRVVVRVGVRVRV